MIERFRKWFFLRGRLQILSLCVAFVAWFVVHSGQKVQQRQIFKVDYINMPSHLIFKKDPPKELRVLLTGSFYRVRSMSPANLSYTVDLSQARSGLNSVDVDLSNLRLPTDVFASNPVPRRLEFQLEELQRKEVPVRVEFVGEPAEAHSVTKVQVTPNPIQLVGPASSIEEIHEISVKVPLDRRSDNFSTSVLLNLDLPQTQSVEAVFVEVEISRLDQERVIQSAPVSISDASKKAKVSPSEARLILRGSSDKLADIQNHLRVLIPVEGLGRGRYRVRAQVKLTEGVQLVAIHPESFIVEVME